MPLKISKKIIKLASKKIIKLARLASNNPNENEANLAARAACKLLVEAVDKKEETTSEPQYRGGWDYSRYRQSYYARENERARQQREQNKPKCRKCGKEREFHPLDTIFPDVQGLCKECKADAQREKEAKETAAGFRGKNEWWTVYEDGSTGPFGTQTKPVKDKRTLECTKCHIKVETVFTGIPQVFVCNTCQWTAYQKDKENK